MTERRSEHKEEYKKEKKFFEKNLTKNRIEIEKEHTNHSEMRKTELIPKAKIADSIFTNLFRIPEYALLLYQVLHPEDRDTKKEQIKIVTIENVLLNQPYNDFGMIVEQRAGSLQTENEIKQKAGIKLLILCEAQSTWSVNILVRMLIYFAQTLKEYITETNQSVYSSRQVNIPNPEFYVIYTGDRKIRPDEFTLADEFGLTNVDLKIKMIYNGKPNDIVYQYLRFRQVYHEQYQRYGRTQRTILETIRICEAQDVLKEYLESRRKEVVDIMMTLFDNDTIMDAYTKEIREEGREEGKAEGKIEGKIEAARETAKEMYEDNFSIEKIAKYVNYPISIIEQWLKATPV